METHQQQESLITSFIEITSSSKEEAVFFLESHNYDLDSAVSTFLDNSSHAAIPASAPHHPIQSPSLVNSSPESSSSPPPPSNPVSRSSPYGLRSTKEKLAASSSSKSINKKRTTRSSSGVRTLADLNRKNGNDGDEDDDEDGDDSDDSDYDERQEYYAGGERSGMLVQDPSRHNDVDSIFNQARQLGAVEESSDSLRPSSGKKNFTGTGRLLSGETIPADPQRPESVTHTIIFWSNGFTVDDGPLRMLDDPQNENFLESIKKGECPKELEPADRRTPVNVNLTRKEENYVEPKKPRVPFRGAGRTLGSSTDAADSDPPVSVTLSSAPSSDVGLVIDENLCLTSIQIRLADGTRMVSRFNYHHTVGDIRDFIDASRLGGSRNYQLQMMGFPPKQLTDPTRTIEQDGLANSVVIQKF